MITKTIETNGVRRTVTGKIFGGEFRVYKIYGDVTKQEELMQMAQELAIDLNCSAVNLSL
jgi:hypothetical protein